jgi:heme A synthase
MKASTLNRLAAVLAFVAAVLTITAFIVQYVHQDEVRWSLLSIAVFLVSMGIGFITRKDDG